MGQIKSRIHNNDKESMWRGRQEEERREAEKITRMRLFKEKSWLI